MSRTTLRFSRFSLEVATRELRRDGERVPITPRSFDCIAYLIQHRERAVGRDELIAAVWGRDSVTDTMLGKTILGARRALGDTAEAQAFIRTVSRFGYHWVAPVVAVDEEAGEAVDAVPAAVPAPPTAPSALPGTARPVRRRRNLAVAALAGVAVAIAAVWIGSAWRDRAPPPTPDPAAAEEPAGHWTAAALPSTISGDAEDAWLRLGLMDLIATRLRGAGLSTVPSDVLLRLLKPDLDADRAARRLRETVGVQQAFVSSARRSGADWTVSIALIRPEGVTLEVEQRDLDPVRATHGAIDRLLQRLGHAPTDRAAAVPPSLDTLLQRTEAARLADDLAGVRRLIAEAPPELAGRPELRLRLAQADLRGGRLEAALATLTQLLEAVSAEASPQLRAQVLYAQGTGLLLATRYPAARAAYDAGIALVDHGIKPDTAARLYMGRGNLSALEGRYDDAAADHARARVGFQVAGDVFMTAWLDGNEGALQNHRGRPADALPLLQRAERHFERFDVVAELAITRANEVVAQLALARPADALAASERALGMLDRLADASAQRLVRLRHASALAANGRSAQAASILSELIETAVTPDEASVRGAALAARARIGLEGGRAADALADAADAIDILVAPQDTRLRADAWLTRLRALRALERLQEADLSGAAFDAWAAQLPLPYARQVAALAAAEQDGARQRFEAAERRYADALDQAVALDLPSALIETVVSQGRFLIGRGRLEPAIASAGRIVRYADQDYASAMLQAELHHALGHTDAERLAVERAARLAGDRPRPPAPP